MTMSEKKAKIKEVEEPDVLEDLKVTIKLDDEEIEQDTDGNYVKVVDASQDNSSLWAGITSETSQVKIKDGNGETEYANPSSQKNLSLKNGVTEATVTVKNGAGEEKESPSVSAQNDRSKNRLIRFDRHAVFCYSGAVCPLDRYR